jgi:hypothetical protein
MGTFLHIFSTLILILVIVIGGWFIYGAFRRLPILFKLSDSGWIYSGRVIQRMFGNRGLFLYYLVVGVTFISAAFIGLITINK